MFSAVFSKDFKASDCHYQHLQPTLETPLTPPKAGQIWQNHGAKESFGDRKNLLKSFEYWWVVLTALQNISQIGNLPQVGVKIKNLWNHHLGLNLDQNLAKPWKKRLFWLGGVPNVSPYFVADFMLVGQLSLHIAPNIFRKTKKHRQMR